MTIRSLVGFTLLLCLAFDVPAEEDAKSNPTDSSRARPNILIVVADDLGWSDIGALGGEIRTPTLDDLADHGTVMTQYYVAPTCSPTRSMLMTGLDNHVAGVGTMRGLQADNQTGRNYGAQLHDALVTLPEALAAQGYETFMAGKWHLAVDETQRPHRRGFSRSFSLLPGGASHFADRKPLSPHEPVEYLEDGQAVELPASFYSSIGYTDKMLEYLQDRDHTRPFLAYLAYTAPHDPLQVPNDWLDKYRGEYDAGPSAIREARVAKLKAKGLIPDNLSLWHPQPFPKLIPNYLAPWSERDTDGRAESARRMEVYAAMVELMDQQIGRLINNLRDQDILDNTLVLFFSDNGASSAAPSIYPGNTPEWLDQNWSLAPRDFGTPAGFAVMSREWANVSNTPWRLFKASVGEGGIRSPLLVRGPGIPAGHVNSALAHVSDIAPTLFDLVGIDTKSDPVFEGKLQPQGVSLLQTWRGESISPRSHFGTELFGSYALRSGQWKASKIRPPMGTGQWELFNLNTDPGETDDLAESEPEVLSKLIEKYQEYAATNGIIHPSTMPSLSLRAFYPSECDWFCELRFKIIDWLPKPN
ncbi:MAG: arylsulfatase [Pseudomonadota bacterium]